MKIEALIEELRKNPKIANAGMILTHTGIVRNTSRDGKVITTLEIEPDFSIIENIVSSNKKLPGIIDIKYYMHKKATLNVGDEIMHIAIAGDIRENTIYAMTKTLNEIKEKAVIKKHNFKQ
ncbi:MAG: molybdenum cofactor biosynthesis protein MoaE [Desulfobacteraceae bacterium]|nr:molybdenum cofactor biosynthesis protein MoaE [Desulfobacteraceae bacterium]MCB9494305.1 molybdenum cofactor biosynthesis protein MoaE [Desulfobacteraceae bacterium]